MKKDRETMEARIVAMVLGEASAFEVSELKQLIEEDPQLEAFYLEMLDVHGALELVHDDKIEDDWKLSDSRRKLVLGAMKEEEQPQAALKSRQTKPWLRAVGSIAAVLVIGGFLATLSYGPVMRQVSTTKNEPEILAFSVGGVDALEVSESRMNEVVSPPAPSAPASRVIAASFGSGVSVPGVDIDLEEATFDFGMEASDDPFADPASESGAIVNNGNRSGSYAVDAFGDSAGEVAFEGSVTAGVHSDYIYRGRRLGADDGGKKWQDVAVAGRVYAKTPKEKKSKVATQWTDVRQSNTEELDFSHIKQLGMGEVKPREDTPRVGDKFLNDAKANSPLGDEERKHLYRAEGYRNLGLLAEAEEAYREVLRKDRYKFGGSKRLGEVSNCSVGLLQGSL